MPRRPASATGAVLLGLHVLLLLVVFALGECRPVHDGPDGGCDPNPPYTTC